MTIPRREFIGGAAALALLSDSFAAAAESVFEQHGRAADFLLCRRLYLDICGRLPSRQETEAFVSSKKRDKVDDLVERLLRTDDFADYWSMRYCDMLRVKSEFPINLWPNAVYVYHRRIRQSIAADEPWDHFAEALLTGLGSNFRVPEANFLRATSDKSAKGLSIVASETFLLKPSERFAQYFSRVRWKSTREWKEEIVYLDEDGSDDDTPKAFFEHLTGPLRDDFLAAPLKRVHWWVFGSLPDSRRQIEWRKAFEQGGLRLKPLLKHVFTSAAYWAGPIRGRFPSRRLDAEVLDDILRKLTGSAAEYRSIAPEPFTLLPEMRKSVLIEDGSITSPFLQRFGRPSRDTGALAERNNRITADQRLFLFNSSTLWQALKRVKGGVDDLYMSFLSRPPTKNERYLIDKNHLDSQTLAWYLVNSREFLYRI